jgi:FtsP/CotA-like multicopper oxidase with cupredoxin domain
VPRRAVLIGVALAVAFAGLAAAAGEDSPPVPTTFPTVQGQPFAEPPVLASRAGVLRIDLRVSATTYAVAGTSIRGQAYDGTFVGPTLRVRPGDTISMRFHNQLSEPTNIHFHGFHASPSGISDNVLRIIPAHRTVPVRVRIPRDMAPGTYWYHSHEHGISEDQVMDGLSGVIVVAGEKRYLPPALRGITEHVFALKDLQAKNGVALRRNIDSNQPTTRTVNGQVDPVLPIRPGETQLWRLANISADIWYRLRADGLRFTVIGQDANPTERVLTRGTLLLPPGKRYDVLVQGPRAGSYSVRTLRFSTGPAGDSYPTRRLATIASSGTATEPSTLPTSQRLPVLMRPRFASQHVDRRRRIVFSESANGNSFFINGTQFKHDVVNQYVRLGDLEEWTIVNTSKEQHPFHIHVNDFQVMSINGHRVRATSLQDTVPLPVNGRVVIRLRFTDFTGRFVFHCHILNHEDGGMMQVVEVYRSHRATAGRAARPRSRTRGAPRRAESQLLCPLLAGIPAARRS